MSTIRVSNIQDTSGGNTSTPAAIANGIAKAWVNFNGTGTVAVRASYNVSSITDANTGEYGINFTSAFTDANFSTVVTAKVDDNNTIGTGNNSTIAGAAVRTTTSVLVFSSSTNSVRVDSAVMNVAIFR